MNRPAQHNVMPLPPHYLERAEPVNGAALDFLHQFAPAGPWVLTAIIGSKIETRTFEADNAEAVHQWFAKAGRKVLYRAVGVENWLAASRRKSASEQVEG